MPHVAIAPGQEYSQVTQRSLQTVDESLINYELLEALVCHIVSSQQATSSDANAILIFMPGAPEISRLVRALQACQLGPYVLHVMLDFHFGIRCSPSEYRYGRATNITGYHAMFKFMPASLE